MKLFRGLRRCWFESCGLANCPRSSGRVLAPRCRGGPARRYRGLPWRRHASRQKGRRGLRERRTLLQRNISHQKWAVVLLLLAPIGARSPFLNTGHEREHCVTNPFAVRHQRA